MSMVSFINIFDENVSKCNVCGMEFNGVIDKCPNCTCVCGQHTHPQLGSYCKDCWWAQNPIEAEDGDYIRVDGDIFLMPEGEMLRS